MRMSDACPLKAGHKADVDRGERLSQEVKHGAKLVCLAVGVALVIRIFLAQPYSIPSESMSPLLKAGDYILVNKTAFGWSRASMLIAFQADGFNPGYGGGRTFGQMPDAGEVIVFLGSNARNDDYVKRVIAREGDRVAMEHGRLYVNGLLIPCTPEGEKLCREKLPNGTSYLVVDGRAKPRESFPEIIVPAGHLFVLGDNRPDSADSRVPADLGGIGLVPEERVIGRASRIFFSHGDGRAVRWDRLWQRVQ